MQRPLQNDGLCLPSVKFSPGVTRHPGLGRGHHDCASQTRKLGCGPPGLGAGSERGVLSTRAGDPTSPPRHRMGANRSPAAQLVTHPGRPAPQRDTVLLSTDLERGTHRSAPDFSLKVIKPTRCNYSHHGCLPQLPRGKADLYPRWGKGLVPVPTHRAQGWGRRTPHQTRPGPTDSASGRVQVGPPLPCGQHRHPHPDRSKACTPEAGPLLPADALPGAQGSCP